MSEATGHIQITPGSDVQERITFGFNVAGFSFSVVDFYPAVLQHATLTVVDEPSGAVDFGLAAAHSAQLNEGRDNFFSVRVLFANGKAAVFDRQWIEAKNDF